MLTQKEQPTMTRRVIRVDGTIEDLPKPVSMRAIENLIDATSLDTVNLRHLGAPLWVMVVDDLGHIVEAHESTAGGVHRTEMRSVGHRKPINRIATELYHANCRPGTTHEIVGDVAIVMDEDFA